MPYIGLIPFLRKEENEENFKGTCVNALPRAYPISTFIKFIKGEHFMCVNALHRAYPISSSPLKRWNKFWKQCVNALHRAYPISTVPFKKPYKINGFRDRFQGVIVRKF